jgi:hypothetical protein
MFAVIQANRSYNWLSEEMVGDVVENGQMDSYRNVNDWDDIEFEEYDVIVIAAGQRQNYDQQYRRNLERFEEYIAGGGAAYFETHDPNSPIHSPGDIVNNIQERTNRGELVVSPDPNDDNYSLFADICHESQENFWEEGEDIRGNAWLHSSYGEDQFQDGVEDGTLSWYQILAESEQGRAGAIAYGFGSGACLVLGHPTGHTWTNWANDGDWGSIGAEILFYLSEIVGPNWLVAEPDEGVIATGESTDIEFTFAPVDLEDGVYEVRVILQLTTGEGENAEQWEMETSAVLSVSSPTVNVTGIVTDPSENDATISGVSADLDQYIIRRFSDDDGAFEFTDLPIGDYELTFTAIDYLPWVEAFEAGEEDDVELEIALLHSECNPNVEGLQNEIAPEEMAEVSFRIDNDGNGPLTYMTDRRLIGDANADPYTVRAEVLAGQANDDSHIRGVMFANDRFYISGSNDNEPVIYVHNRDGEHLETFEQPGEDRNGMRDLAFDGDLLWGPSGDRIFGLSLDGEVQADLESPFNLTGCLAYDPDLDVLWVAYTTTNIVMMDRDGNIQGDFGRQGLRMNGFAYWPDDPDGYNLYIYNMFDDGDGRRPALHKMNTEDGDIMFVSYLETERGGNSLGCYITNQYDIYSWVMIAAVTASDNQGGDRIDIWQVDARREWMLLDPTEGVIEPDESQEFTLTFNAAGLPAEQFRGEIVFIHDGIGGETSIPLTLNVVEGPVHTTRRLDLHRGWNMVSVYLQPDEEEIEVLMAPLVEQDVLLIMKNSDGEFYRPDAGFNNIDRWNVDEGYLMKLSAPGDIELEGTTVLSDEPIDLEEGWQIISCYLRFPVDATIAFSGVVDQMLIVKDENGNFYNPEFNFSNMGDVTNGNGYQLKMSEDAELIYRFQMDEDEGAGVYSQQGIIEPSRLGVHANTGSNMSLLVLSSTDISGDIGVYSNDVLVGSGVMTDGNLGISIWGDDLSTEAIDGAVDGADLELRLYEGSTFRELTYSSLRGDGSYATDAMWVVELTGAKALPTEFGIESVYPNPFNNRTLVRFGLSDVSAANVRLYDLSGRLLRDISLGRLSVGGHTMTIDGADLSSGVYILELTAGANVSRRKLTLVK